jgi:hypothetical protein
MSEIEKFNEAAAKDPGLQKKLVALYTKALAQCGAVTKELKFTLTDREFIRILSRFLSVVSQRELSDAELAAAVGGDACWNWSWSAGGGGGSRT